MTRTGDLDEEGSGGPPGIQPEAPAERTISDIVNEGGGPRSYYRFAKWMVAAAIVAIVATIVVPMLPRSMSYRAHQIVALPKDATLVDVDDSLGRGYGDITFTVPEPAGPGTRLLPIWNDLGMPTPPVASKAPVGKAPVYPLPASRPGSRSPGSASLRSARPPSKAHLVLPYVRPDLKSRKDLLEYDGWDAVYILRYDRPRRRYRFQKTESRRRSAPWDSSED